MIDNIDLLLKELIEEIHLIRMELTEKSERLVGTLEDLNMSLKKLSKKRIRIYTYPGFDSLKQGIVSAISELIVYEE